MLSFLRLSGKFACAAFLIALVGDLTGTAAQRVAILDFSSTVSKPRKHPPKPFPPGTMLGGRPGGMTSGKLIVSVLSMDKSEYSPEDEINYTLEVRVAGAETVKLPTVINLADLEPDGPDVDLNYEAIEIWLGFFEESHERYISVPLLRLYGSEDMPWSEIELKPGMSVELRGKAKLKRLDPESPTDSEGRRFDAPYMGSTEDLPKGEVLVSATCWRGDKFSYKGSTHFEYPGSFVPEEMSTVVYGKKITLLAVPDH